MARIHHESRRRQRTGARWPSVTKRSRGEVRQHRAARSPSALAVRTPTLSLILSPLKPVGYPPCRYRQVTRDPKHFPAGGQQVETQRGGEQVAGELRHTGHRFVPTLRYRRLTPLYDALLRVTMRESTFRRVMVEQLELRGGLRVLDLGCGTGSLALLIKQLHPDVEVVGIDADPDVLDIARAKAAAAGLEVELIHGGIDALAAPDSSFNRVVSSLVFHHLKLGVKRVALREAHRVLREQGSYCLADWDPMSSPWLRAMFLPGPALDGRENT